MTTADTMTPVLPATPETEKRGGCSSPASCSPPVFYSDALVTIHHGDARELLPQIEADFLLTDPPYGTKKYQHDVDGYALLTPEVLARFEIAAVFGWPEKLIGWCIKNGCTPDEWITWWPTNGALRAFNPFGLGRESESIAAFGQAWKWELLKRECAHESKRLAAANYKSDNKSHGGLKHNGKTSRMGDVWRVAAPGLGFNAKKRLHTNEKPMGVLQLLLDAAPDARVLCDPFCGSGTALCAAKRAGIKSIGIEIDERHCETAARRCASELAMGKAENKEYRNSGSDNARPVPGTKPEVADGLFMDLKGSESAEKPLIK